MLKNISITLLIKIAAVIFICSGISLPQECDDCSHPRVALFDFEMKVERPEIDTLITKWLELFFPGVSARAYVRNNDPNKNCISWYDGAVIKANTLQDGTFRYGSEYTNLPPAGPFSSADYILSGYTVELTGQYESTLTLETAESRELVKSVSVTYQNETDAVTEAGIAIANKFGSIYNVIKDFERYKRDTDNEVAIRDLWSKDTPAEIVLTPAKRKIETDESIDIDVEMIDCDGVPLGNRKIYFVDTTVNDMEFNGTASGKIEPSVVITDASGKAKVKFTADETTGVTQISAFFPHKKPCGRNGGFIGTTTVVVGTPPPDTWILHAVVSEQTIRSIDTSWSDNNYRGEFSVYEKMEGTASITGLIENSSDDSFYAVYYDEYGYPLENCSINGYGTVDYFRKSYKEWESPLPDINIENKSLRGTVTEGYTGFEFHYPTETDDIVIVALCGGMAKGTSHWTHSVYFPERKIEKETNKASTLFNVSATFLDGQCSVVKTDSAYQISGFLTTEDKKHIIGSGLETTTRTTSLKASLSLDGSLTGIENKKTSPSAFSLDQNFPNPFNPTTTISFSLPNEGKAAVKIYDIMGREVITLLNGMKSAGNYKVIWEGMDSSGKEVASGIYFYNMKFEDKSITKKMMLVR